MPPAQPPNAPEPPDLPRLAKATAAALVVALVVLVVAVLPAEYGVDPTGVGAATGLNALADGASGVGVPAHRNTHMPFRVDTVNVTIPAGQGLEYKFQVREGAVLLYEWITDNGTLTYDLHAERAGDTSGDFTSYETGATTYAAGTLVAPFTGTHGWWWKNNGHQDVTVTLRTSGVYQVVGVK